MRPLQGHLADGAVKSNHETIDVLSRHFQLTNDELAELLPSGQQSVFTNRIAWAKAHLKKAGFSESLSRGLYKVTPRGIEALAQAVCALPDLITIKIHENEINTSRTR